VNEERYTKGRELLISIVSMLVKMAQKQRTGTGKELRLCKMSANVIAGSCEAAAELHPLIDFLML
jgi:hypothetical protein